jgi:ribosomal protein S18 acetylase RimI-like enzyme
MVIREALAGEMGAVGALRVAAYQAQGLLGANPSYAATLAALGADGHGTVLIAADAGELAGTVMLEPWHAGSEVARGPDEAEVRALAVAPAAQGQGTGRALLRAVIDRAAAAGLASLLLSTQPQMAAAQALYASAGFARRPDLDWSPVPGLALLAFWLPLPGRAPAPAAGPPGVAQ